METTNRVVRWRKSSRSGGNGTNCVEVGQVVSWRKSSRSAGNGSNCVEVGQVASWRKSSRSAGNGSACVEVGQTISEILVRDTKNREGGTLEFSPNTWHRFLNTH